MTGIGFSCPPGLICEGRQKMRLLVWNPPNHLLFHDGFSLADEGLGLLQGHFGNHLISNAKDNPTHHLPLHGNIVTVWTS